MATSSKALLQAALALPADDRIDLAEQLLLSLGEHRAAEVDAAWKIEINRRLNELDSGAATVIPYSDAMRQIRERRRK